MNGRLIIIILESESISISSQLKPMVGFFEIGITWEMVEEGSGWLNLIGALEASTQRKKH